MPIRVTLNRQIGVIEVNAHGDLLRSEMEEANVEILRIYREKGINKILGDATKVEKAPSTADSFEVWSEFPREFRHAIVLRVSDPTGENASFIENVGVNRGQNMRVFETREDAIRWLLEE